MITLWSTLMAATAALFATSVRTAAIPAPVAVISLEPFLRAQATVHAIVAGVDGQVSGFRMSGERLDNPHCDNLVFEIGTERLKAPAVTTVDIMKLMGPGVPAIDGAIGLDLFAGKQITIVPRKQIIVESPQSFAARITTARENPIRIVRDVEGLALSVDGAVETPLGFAWMELDSGNGGSLVVANHIAPLLGFKTDGSTPEPMRFRLANGIVVDGMGRTRDLIMDGNLGAQFLNQWNLTLDLKAGRAWLSPAPGSG